MPRKPVPDKIKDVINNMKDIGLSNNTIAKVTGYSRKTVIKYIKDGVEVEESVEDNNQNT